MIGDNPVFGVGLRNFRDHYAYYSTLDGTGGEAKVAHNSYLQIWAEGGTVTFLAYLCLLGSVFVGCFWLKRMARSRPHLGWAGAYGRMFEASTVGFMVGAVFLNRGHFDLIYHGIALVSASIYVAQREMAQGPVTDEATEGEEVPAQAAGGVPAPVEIRWGGPVPGSALPRWGR